MERKSERERQREGDTETETETGTGTESGRDSGRRQRERIERAAGGGTTHRVGVGASASVAAVGLGIAGGGARRQVDAFVPHLRESVRRVSGTESGAGAESHRGAHTLSERNTVCRAATSSADRQSRPQPTRLSCESYVPSNSACTSAQDSGAEFAGKTQSDMPTRARAHARQ